MYELGAADVLNDTTTSHNNTSHYNFNFYVLVVVLWNNLSLFLLLLPRSLLSYNFVIKTHMACGVSQKNRVV